LLLGITIGLAILTKNAGLLLLLYTIGVLILLAIRDGRRRQLARALVLVIVPAVLIGGWLWWRNWSLYGDPTAANQFIRIAGGDRGYTLAQVLGESDGLLLSLVGVFGWFNVRPADGVYLFWGGVAFVAVTGLVYCAVLRSRQVDTPGYPKGFVAKVARQLGQPWIPGLFLAGWVLAVYAGLLAFMTQTEAAQGRLLFPAILPLALGAAYGLVGDGECARRGLPAIVRRVWGLPIVLALATTLYCLIFVIRPTYTRPALVEAIPESAWPVLPALADRGHGVHLLATAVESEEVEPGELLWLTFYWRVDTSLLPEQRTATALANSAPEFVLELFGRDVTRVANLHSYHGRGLYPANLWPAGLLVADRFAVRLDEGMESPVLGRIFARLANGAPGIEVNTVKIVPATWPEPPLETIAQLGGSIELAEARVRPEVGTAGDVVTITARWYVSGPAPGEEFTTLIHLGQPDVPPLATGDRPPVNGDYPTRIWEEGETIADDYTLTIPDGLESGRYPVWIGMYDPRTGQRLPLTIDGQPQPNNVYLAGWVEIQSE
jgi:hypothetical protein